MTRQQIISDMQQTLGVSPDWLTGFPDQLLQHVWESVKNFQLGQTAIPNKYKELIGLGVASQMQCSYCIYFHTEAARMWGASDEEIKEATSMAMMTAGLSTDIAGTGYDRNKFKQETDRIIQHAKSQAQMQRRAA